MEAREVLSGVRGLGHKVTSGSWPLYRLVALFILVGSVAQLVYGAPPSVAKATPPWFDPLFTGFMLIAACVICIAIGIMRGTTIASAYLEQAGAILLFGALFINQMSYIVANGVPKTYQSWLPFAIMVYLVFRYFELRRKIRVTFHEKARRERARALGQGDSQPGGYEIGAPE